MKGMIFLIILPLVAIAIGKSMEAEVNKGQELSIKDKIKLYSALLFVPLVVAGLSKWPVGQVVALLLVFCIAIAGVILKGLYLPKALLQEIVAYAGIANAVILSDKQPIAFKIYLVITGILIVLGFLISLVRTKKPDLIKGKKIREAVIITGVIVLPIVVLILLEVWIDFLPPWRS